MNTSIKSMKRIAIIGTGPDRNRFSNKAVRAYKKHGWQVIPVTPNYDEVEGIKAVRSVKDITGAVDVASFYVRPDIGMRIADQVIGKNIPAVYLNPGSESEALIEKLKAGGVETHLMCSIIALGENPDEF